MANLTGAALDARVHELIGWKMLPNRCPVCGWQFAEWPAGIGCHPGDCSMRPPPAVRADAPRPYSSDPAACAEVKREIVRRGWSLTIGLYRDRSAFAQIKPAFGMGVLVDPCDHAEETAVCRAFVAACESAAPAKGTR